MISYKFSDNVDWLSGRPLPKDDLTVPFVGTLSDITPVRRLDVGDARLTTGTPMTAAAAHDRNGLPLKNTRQELFQTQVGPISLPKNEVS